LPPLSRLGDVLKDHPAPLGHPGQQERREKRATKLIRALQVPSAQQDHLDHLDQRDRPDRGDRPVPSPKDPKGGTTKTGTICYRYRAGRGYSCVIGRRVPASMNSSVSRLRSSRLIVFGRELNHQLLQMLDVGPTAHISSSLSSLSASDAGQSKALRDCREQVGHTGSCKGRLDAAGKRPAATRTGRPDDE
jgi:hypothetical protein